MSENPPRKTSVAPTEPLPSDVSDETSSSIDDILSVACEECGALYIPSNSMLLDQAEHISDIATASGVSTIGGDIHIGKHTLTSLFHDPYDQGYRAGKQAYQILIRGSDPSAISFGNNSGSLRIKMYQDIYAYRLSMSFPKSFHEIDAYLRRYTPGYFTERIHHASEEE